MNVPPKTLTVLDKFAYTLSIITNESKKQFLQKHEEALDFVMARQLSVPGLDHDLIKPQFPGLKLALPKPIIK